MRHSLKKTRHPLSASLLAVVLAVGTSIAYAEPGQARQGMQAAMQHQGGMHGGQHGKTHRGAGKQGACGMHGKTHGKKHGKKHGEHGKGHHLLGGHWRQSLTDAQKVQLDRLHLEYAKKKLPLKSGMKALKMQLAVLATSDNPQPGTFDAQINELLMAKRQLMVAKYEYIAAQRRVLTPEQRLSFDMDVLHKAAGDDKKKRDHGGGHH
jgi:Spy/CpxP family protein refolding chaperone